MSLDCGQFWVPVTAMITRDSPDSSSVYLAGLYSSSTKKASGLFLTVEDIEVPDLSASLHRDGIGSSSKCYCVARAIFFFQVENILSQKKQERLREFTRVPTHTQETSKASPVPPQAQ